VSEVDLDPESESDAAVSSMILGMYEVRSNLQNNGIDCMIRMSCGTASKSVGKALPLIHGTVLGYDSRGKLHVGGMELGSLQRPPLASHR
jgi:hypothetical protein